MTWVLPPDYVVLDLETTAGDPVEAEAWMRRAWSPNPRWTNETIGTRYRQALEKKQERLALLDSAPIISVAMKTPHDCRVVHHLATDGPAVPGVVFQRCADQPDMLRRVAAYLGCCTAETALIGHNLLRFDLPKLRQAMLRHGVGLPPCLVWRDHPVFDTMREWSRFTLDDRQHVPLAELLEACGLPDHKATVDGSAVPELHEAGRFDEILIYAALDVLAEHAVFERMTGAR